MVIEGLTSVCNRYRPEEGWLPVVLLVAVVVVMIASVLSVGWVPEDRVIIPSALLGLLLGFALARRPLATWAAWTFIVIYGFLVTTLTLANLWPPIHLLVNDWPALRLYWLESGALFADRAGSWFTAVFIGSQSNETIIFAFLMGITAWMLAAYAAWSTFRLQRPLLGLTFMGLFVAINGYYGEVPVEFIVAFVGVALLTTAALHFANLEWSWQRRHVDYSGEIRMDIFIYAAIIGMILLGLAYALPAVSPSRWARALLSQPAFAAFEETYARSFAGVEPPRQLPVAPGMAGGAGIMPRSFLLGNPPELEKNIMLTAQVQRLSGPQGATLNLARHWRGLSYEIYTGRGWSLSEERTRDYDAAEEIPLAPARQVMMIEQTVNWRFDDRVIRYTLGFPASFDQPVTTYWRDDVDFVRASSEDVPRYQVISQFSAATPEELRRALLSDLPAEITARYTQLPVDLPPRIGDLAAEVTSAAVTPYDQALALERFLRQYQYSLDVELPPAGVDPVDFFLFDLQEGYCDYYASSMVVMARTLGLPARVATGFLAQPAADDGVQTVRQINAHSWAEVYFGEYGWIEFEPTAAFLSPHDPRLAAGSESDFSAETPYETPYEAPALPIPDRAPQPVFPLLAVLLAVSGLVLTGLVIFWVVKRTRQDVDDVQRAFGRLQTWARRLGQPVEPSQTPDEFNSDLLHGLDKIGRRPRVKRIVANLRTPINQLTDLFIQRQYSGQPIENPRTAVSLWQRIRRPLWILWLDKRLRRRGDNE